MAQQRRNERIESERRRRESERDEEEMRECSFAPRTSPTPLAIVERRAATHLKGLANAQQRVRDRLAAVGVAEQALRERFESRCAEEGERVMREATAGAFGSHFLETAAGRQVLAERVAAYKEFNPGLSDDRARLEATRDLQGVAAEQWRDKVVANLEEQFQSELESHQVVRSELIRELLKVDADARQVLNDFPALPPADVWALCTEFDPHLVDKLRAEPWYAEAQLSAH